MDITARKTSTLRSLQRQLNDATTVAAKTESTYESFVNKAQFFSDLYKQATADLNTLNTQWTQFLTVKSSILALEQTSDESNLVAQVTNNNIKKLVKKWEQVVLHTLEAADAINLASDYINKRKASNILISADLVSDATLAANNAATTVTLVINALTASLNTLTVASQANNSTDLTGMYIDLASAALLAPVSPGAAVQAAHTPLETSLSALLNKTKRRQLAVQAALNNANAEMAAAKETMDSANAKVVAAQAALNAAQAAVNA
jgi:hypothetical protein